MRTSPDVECAPLLAAIAQARDLRPTSVSVGAGSSEIIHRVLPSLALRGGPCVVTDPTYSEYSFVLGRLGAPLVRVTADLAADFALDLGELVSASRGAALVVLVNPSNPTGRFLSREDVLWLRSALDAKTVLWVDEAYVDYGPVGVSVEADASEMPNFYVLKSLSKAYALSGIRAAYLVCLPSEADIIRASTPPWIVGTSAQAAASAALASPDYYQPLWMETVSRAAEFAGLVERLGLRTWHGALNAILVRAPRDGSASAWAYALATQGVMVRTPEGMGPSLADDYIRIGLVERRYWPAIIEALDATLADWRTPASPASSIR